MVLGIIVLLCSIHWHASRHVTAARHCFQTFPHFSFLLPWLKQSFYAKKKIIRNIAEPFFYSKHLAYYQVKIANYMASLFHLQCE